MANVIIDKDLCKGCGLCTLFCPKKIVVTSEGLNAKGFHPVEVRDMDACTGCAFCARMCPDCVIEVEK